MPGIHVLMLRIKDVGDTRNLTRMICAISIPAASQVYPTGGDKPGHDEK